MLAKFKPVLNADEVPCADVCPKVERLEELKGEVVLTVNAGVELNKEVDDDDVEPKWLDTVGVAKGEEPANALGVVPKPLLNPGVF